MSALRATVLLAALICTASAQVYYCCLYSNPEFGQLPIPPFCSTTGCGGNGLLALYLNAFVLVDDCANCTASLAQAGAASLSADAPQALDVMTEVAGAETALAILDSSALNSPFCCIDYKFNPSFPDAATTVTYVQAGACNNISSYEINLYGFVQNSSSCAFNEPTPNTPLYCCVYFTMRPPLNTYALVSSGGCPANNALNNSCGGFGTQSSCRFNSFFLIDTPAECANVSTPNCEVYDGDCEHCTSIIGCGYCYTDNTCRVGSSAGPATGDQCMTNSTSGDGLVSMWGWGVNNCAFGPCPQAIFLNDPCSGCLNVPGCGYCAGSIGMSSSAHCLWGNDTGPLYTQCYSVFGQKVPATYNPWFFGDAMDVCPAYVCPARGDGNCSDCVSNDGLCSACWNSSLSVACMPYNENSCGALSPNFSPMANSNDSCATAYLCHDTTDCYECIAHGPGVCGWCDNQGGCWSPDSLLPPCTLLCSTNATCAWPVNHPVSGCNGPPPPSPPPPPALPSATTGVETSTTGDATTGAATTSEGATTGATTAATADGLSGSSSTTASSGAPPSSHTGAIVGGVIAGVVVLAAIAGGLYYRHTHCVGRSEKERLLNRS